MKPVSPLPSSVPPLFPPSTLHKDSPRSRGAAKGFSLTEVVIALGVATVAFTSIIGLFPLGLSMSKESYESVQASLLAQTILADLKDQQTGNGNARVPTSVYTTRLLQIGPNSDPTMDSNTNYISLPINILTPVSAYVAYDELPRINSDTDPAKAVMLRPCAFSTTAVPDWYLNGSNRLFAVVKITLSPTCRFGTATSSTYPVRVDVAVETPGSANLSNRTSYLFTGVSRF